MRNKINKHYFVFINCKYLYFSFETEVDYEFILPNDQCTLRACAIGMGAIESSYFTQVTDCINNFEHPDMAALLVFLQYFTQLEVFCLLIITNKKYCVFINSY